MAVFEQFPGMNQVGERAAKAWQTPLGAVSPLWMAFGAAAGAGVAYWWLTHWARAVNVEAVMDHAAAPAPLALLEAPVEPAPAVETTPEPEPESEPKPSVAEAAPPAEVEAEAEPELALMDAEPESAVVAAAELADDLTRMSGIGPKLAKALADRGVTSFAQIAAWSADDMAEFDKVLSLKGRAMREAWVAQAKRLAAGA
jgi:predicted flap endonuclease-1-like 5' DNA nuclease